jgi:hypothetical protein
MKRFFFVFSFPFILGAAACGSGASTTEPGTEPAGNTAGNTASPAPSASSTSGSSSGGGSTPSGGMPSTPPAGTGNVVIHLRASAKQVTHTDGLPGQTPRDEYVGIRGLILSNGDTDPNPLVVFDNKSFIEARVNDGDDTIVATVPAKTLRAGHFTQARTLVTHARFKVDGVSHDAALPVAGEVEELIVVSDGTNVGGAVHNSGDYVATFTAASVTIGPISSTMTIPNGLSSGGITLQVDKGQASYVYPVDVTVDPTITADEQSYFDINTFECFRWQDENLLGYAPGVFDFVGSLQSWETVKQFGPNSFQLTLVWPNKPEK